MGSYCGCLEGISSKRRIRLHQVRPVTAAKGSSAGNGKAIDDLKGGSPDCKVDLERRPAGIASDLTPLLTDRTNTTTAIGSEPFTGRSEIFSSRTGEDEEEEDTESEAVDEIKDTKGQKGQQWWRSTIDRQDLASVAASLHEKLIGCWRYHPAPTSTYQISKVESDLHFNEEHDSGRRVFGVLVPQDSWFRGALHYTDNSEECGTIRIRYDFAKDVIVSNFSPVGEDWWSGDMVGEKVPSSPPANQEPEHEGSPQARRSSTRSTAVSRSQTETSRRSQDIPVGLDKLPRRVREKLVRSQNRGRCDSEGRRRLRTSDNCSGKQAEPEPEREGSPSMYTQYSSISGMPDNMDVLAQDSEPREHILTVQMGSAGLREPCCPVLFAHCCPSPGGIEFNESSLTPPPPLPVRSSVH